MTQYVVRRFIQMVPVFLFTSFLLFALVRVLPGDPAAVILGQKGTPEAYEALRERLGLNRPLPLQYFHWLAGMARGDFGQSLIQGFSVSDQLKRKVPVTMELAIGATIVALAIGLPVGTAGALFRSRLLNRWLASFNSLALATPTFWLGILLSLFVGLKLGWLPPQGYVPFNQDPLQSIRYMILPSFTLGLAIAAVVARFLQASIMEILDQDFVRTAVAKGLPWRSVIIHHVMKNALIPTVTVVGLQFGALASGAVVTEGVFRLPGLGDMLWVAIQRRDYLVVQSTAMVILIAVIVINLATDIIYGYLDPRIQYG